MKIKWMMLAIGLICGVSFAAAEEARVDLRIPDVNIEGLQGENNVVALWVEDGREDARLGKNLEGVDLVPSQDAAAVIMATLITTLRSAGFRLEPYRADAPLAMLIHVQSLTYDSEKGKVSSKARVSATLLATVSHDGQKAMEKTFSTSGEYTVAWRPSKARIGEIVGETLGDAVRAVLQSAELGLALKESPKETEFE